MRTLTLRERAVIETRYGLGDADAATVSEAARRLGLRPREVRHLEALVLRKLRATPEVGAPRRRIAVEGVASVARSGAPDRAAAPCEGSGGARRARRQACASCRSARAAGSAASGAATGATGSAATGAPGRAAATRVLIA